MYLIGFGAAWLLGRWRARRDDSPVTPRQMEDVLIFGAVGAILGGRIGHVIFYEPAMRFVTVRPRNPVQLQETLERLPATEGIGRDELVDSLDLLTHLASGATAEENSENPLVGVRAPWSPPRGGGSQGFLECLGQHAIGMRQSSNIPLDEVTNHGWPFPCVSIAARLLPCDIKK